MRSSRLILSAILAFGLVSTSLAAAAEKLTITLKTGDVIIELADDVAPQHAARLKALADAGEYDNVAFHRVIEGFMAQTGDVAFGDMEDGFTPQRAGMGGSSQPDLKAEFSDVPFERGVVGMARSQDPNSANSQFFIMFAPAPGLNGQYTVVGKVSEGMEHVDQIKRGDQGNNGAVTDPDRMIKVRSGG
ncbi:MAG: peptidylprolyl isomerase [Hoeflea sp. BRH_c9]|nr:MAG: peptidylprolyl isomerase [Hoeflea sp. BRH_c9]